MTEPRIDYLPISKVKGNPRNPKSHDIPTLIESIQRFGFTVPLVLDEKTGLLVAGHGRLEALRTIQASGAKPPLRIQAKGKEWLVPVMRGLSFKDEREAEAYLLADNRLVEAGGWDRPMLAGLLKVLRQEGDELKGLGFVASEADRMIARIGQKKERTSKESNGEKASPDSGYMAHAIRQVVLYFTVAEFQTILDRLKVMMEKTGTRNHTEAFNRLLDEWEKAHG